MDYPPSIAAYYEACDEIRSWMPTWLSSRDFDRLSEANRPVQRRLTRYSPESLALPLVHGDPNLALLKEMQRAGIVEVEGRDGAIHYRAV